MDLFPPQVHCVHNGPSALADRFADAVFESLLFREHGLNQRISETPAAAGNLLGQSVSAAVFRNTIHEVLVKHVSCKNALKQVADIARSGACARKPRLERSHFPLVILKIADQVQMPAFDVAQRIISSGEVSIPIPEQVGWMSSEWYESSPIQRTISQQLHKMVGLCNRFKTTSALAAAVLALSNNGGFPLFPQEALTFIVSAAERKEGKNMCLRSFSYIIVHGVSFATPKADISSPEVLAMRLKSGLQAVQKFVTAMDARVEHPKSPTQAELHRLDPPSVEVILSSPQPQRFPASQRNFAKLVQRSLDMHEFSCSRQVTPRKKAIPASQSPALTASLVPDSVQMSELSSSRQVSPRKDNISASQPPSSLVPTVSNSVGIQELSSSQQGTPRNGTIPGANSPASLLSRGSNTVHISTPYPKLCHGAYRRSIRKQHGIRRTMSESDSVTTSSSNVDLGEGTRGGQKSTCLSALFIIVSIVLVSLGASIVLMILDYNGKLDDLPRILGHFGTPV